MCLLVGQAQQAWLGHCRQWQLHHSNGQGCFCCDHRLSKQSRLPPSTPACCRVPMAEVKRQTRHHSGTCTFFSRPRSQMTWPAFSAAAARSGLGSSCCRALWASANTGVKPGAPWHHCTSLQQHAHAMRPAQSASCCQLSARLQTLGGRLSIVHPKQSSHNFLQAACPTGWPAWRLLMQNNARHTSRQLLYSDPCPFR